MIVRSFFSATAALALAACTPSVYRADVGAMFVQGAGELALQNSAGSLALGNEQNDLDRDLDLGGMEASPYLKLEWEHARHRVRVSGFGVESSGSGELAGDYGNILAGSLVETSMSFLAAGGSYTYDVIGHKAFLLGLGVHLGYYRLDVTARSGAGPEKVETDLLVPMPYAEAEYRVGQFVFGAGTSVMAGDFNDADGRYIDAEAVVRWRPQKSMEVIGGFRHVVLDAFGRASSRDFDADLYLNGFFLGGGVAF